MLKTFITHSNGDIYLNELRRFVLSGVLVPTFDNAQIKMPPAIGSEPGMSSSFTFEGPQDAHSSLKSLTGEQGLRKLGTGTLDVLAGAAAVAGTGTKFTRELYATAGPAVGDTIIVVDDTGVTQTRTVLAIASDTALTASAVYPNAVTAKPFVWFTPVVSDVSDKMRVKITDLAWRRELMNRPVPVQHVFGTAQKPFFLAEPLLLERNQVLLFSFYNYSTLGYGSFAPNGEVRKFQMEAMRKPAVKEELDKLYVRKIWYYPYWLTMDEDLSISPGSYVVRYFSNLGDTALYLRNVYGYAVTAGAAGDLQEKVTVELFDTRTGRAYQSAPVTLNNLCGNAQTPFELPSPLIVQPEGQIKAVFRSLVTDAPVDVYMTFAGVAVMKDRAGLLASNVTGQGRMMYVQEQKPEFILSSVRA